MVWAFPRFEHPHFQTLVIWASPVTITVTVTLIWIVKVIWEEDALITRVLGTGMPKTRGYPYHYHNGTQSSSCIRYFRKEKRTGAEMPPAIFSGIGQFANSHVRYIKILTWLGSEALWSFFYILDFFPVLKPLVGVARQWSLEKFAILALKPRSHVRILKYQRWAGICKVFPCG